MLIRLSNEITVVRPESKAVFPYSNSLFIEDDQTVMIDAGAGGRAYQEISLENVNSLVLSHYHFDHLSGWQFFKNSRVLAGAEERWAYEDEQKFLLSSGYQHWETLMGNEKSESWSKRIEMPEDVPGKPGFQSLKIDEYYQDGEVFQTGHTSFIAIHTPGHSPGHYAFFFPKEKILFSSDMDISPRGPWYGGEYSDFDEIVDSVERLIDLKPEILVTSHRRVFYDDIQKHFRDYLDIALRKEQNIYRYLAEPRTLDEIASQDFVYESEERSAHDVFWTKMMIIRHLNRMQKYHQISKLPDGRFRQY